MGKGKLCPGKMRSRVLVLGEVGCAGQGGVRKSSKATQEGRGAGSSAGCVCGGFQSCHRMTVLLLSLA